MKLDKDKIEALSKMIDDELFVFVRKTAAKNGISMPDRKPTESEMASLRELLSNAEKINTVAALKLINKYKRGS